MGLVTRRSREPITKKDLARLAEIARADREEMFARSPHWARYRNRLLCVALCQGAAKHYLDRRNGVKDFDVWTFFRALSNRYPDPCLYRRNKASDYGSSKFGRHPDLPDYAGRKVDLLSRSLLVNNDVSAAEAIRQWIRDARPGSSPHYLSAKAIVLIEPHLGFIVWPEGYTLPRT